MKKFLPFVLILCLLACLPLLAHAEAASPTATGEVKEIELTFQGKTITCHPISLTQGEDGSFELILYIAGESEFVLSQQYNIMAPIYACILNDEGKPLSPNEVKWSKDVLDCCYFYYQVEKMPETLALIPMDSVGDSTKWYTLTLADVPTETPEAYVYPAEEKK